MKIATWNVERLKKKKYLSEILSEIEKIEAKIKALETEIAQIPKQKEAILKKNL